MAAQRERDAALDRVNRVRGMTIVGAGALTAAVAALVSAAAPGRTLGAKAPVGTGTVLAPHTTGRVASRRMPPLASPSQLGLESPGSVPQAAPTAPPAQVQPPAAPAPAPQPAPVSGGS
jgi:hypothetical protein